MYNDERTQGSCPKVIFVNRYFHPDDSATSRLLSDVAFDCAQSGAPVHVVTSRQRYDDPAARLRPRECISAVEVHRVWTSRYGRNRLSGRLLDYVSFYAAAAGRLLRLARPGDLIVAKTDPPLLSVLAAAAARTRGARLVNWLQDLFPEIAEEIGVTAVSAWRSSALRGLRNVSLRAADLNVVLSLDMAAKLLSDGLPSERMTVIPNWADGSQIWPVSPELNPLRAAWGLSDKFVVGYSGNMGRAHEFGTVLEAATSLRKDSRIVFLFVGEGAQKARILDGARTRGLDNLAFRPYQPYPQLAESLSVADLHLVSLLPTLEGLVVPSKFYSAIAAGRPVIFVGREDGEIAGAVREADCGRVVRPGDAPGLAAAVLQMMADRERRRRLGHNARTLFERKFDKPFGLAAWRKVLAATARPGFIGGS